MLSLLEKWYHHQCNGLWEHQRGIKIGTLDNPGWSLKVDLMDTAKQGTTLEWVQIDRSEHDWIHYRVEKEQFVAYCGPENLSEVIGLFVRWFESNE